MLEHMKDLALYAIKVAESLGVKYAEARVQVDVRRTIVLKNGTPDVMGLQKQCGLCVRVLEGGGLGFSSTNILSKDKIKEIVEAAARIARISGKLRKKPIEFSKEDAISDTDIIKPQIPFEDVSLEDKISDLVECDKSALERGRELKISVPWRLFSASELVTEKYYVNTEGTSIHSHVPRLFLECVVTAHESAAGYEQMFLELGASKGYEALKEWRVEERVEECVDVLARILREAKSPPKETVDVVLGPQVVGLVCHESVGHPYEADRILGREAAQAGESFVTRDLLGTRIGSECVNVVDDPTIPHSYGYYKYDDEGVRARKRYLIKNGIINEFLHNRETAAVFGVSSNAAARSVAYDREPIVRMANTFIEPGDFSFDELIEDIKIGVYMKTFGEWNIDDRRVNQRYVGKEAYLIKDGELAGMVRAPVLEITTHKLWSSVDAVGRKELVEFFAALCGKGDPEQLCPVWMGGPPIRLRNVKLGG